MTGRLDTGSTDSAGELPGPIATLVIVTGAVPSFTAVSVWSSTLPLHAVVSNTICEGDSSRSGTPTVAVALIVMALSLGGGSSLLMIRLPGACVVVVESAGGGEGVLSRQPGAEPL